MYRLVADRIRYVGLEYGIHSFQPAHASETWSLGYGDCKDKAVLLIAMLSAVGIPSQFVLVRTRSAGAIERKPASLSAFDHAIVYLPGLKAFIDPTVSDFDPFVLPTEDQGAQVLVVGSGELTRVPVTAAALNREEWTVTLEKTNNTLFGTVAAKIIGQGATHLRRKLSDLNQRERRAKNWLNQLIPQAQFSDIEYSGVTPTRDPVTLDARVQSPAALNSSQSNEPSTWLIELALSGILGTRCSPHATPRFTPTLSTSCQNDVERHTHRQWSSAQRYDQVALRRT